MSPLHSLIRKEEGQALAEFALVLPLLVLVLFSMIHFGKAFNYWNTATHITAEGARYAAVNSKPFPADVTSLQGQLLAQAHTDELRNGGPGADAVKTPATVCIDFPSGAATRGAPVRVTMTFTYSWMPLIGGALGTGSSTITSSSIMRLETAPTTLVAGCA